MATSATTFLTTASDALTTAAHSAGATASLPGRAASGGGDLVSEVFGYVLMAVAVLLASRERRAFRERGSDAWLITRRRYRRRLLISVVMLATGGLLAAWGADAISFQRGGQPNVLLFTTFVFAITGLCLLMLVLAMIDLSDTANNAAKHALDEFPMARQVLPEELRDVVDDRKPPAGSN